MIKDLKKIYSNNFDIFKLFVSIKKNLKMIRVDVLKSNALSIQIFRIRFI